MSLKIEKLWDILEKSLNFPQKFLNIFESSLYKNNLNFKKKCFGQKKRLKAQQYANFPGDHESVFYDFNVPGIVYFPLFEVPSWGKVL